MTEEKTLKDGIYPVLALRDIVIYPHVIAPLFVGRDKSIAALENAMENNKQVLLLAQKDALIDTPYTGDLYKVGTLASILQLLKLPDGTVKILIEGNARAQVVDFTQNNNFFEAHAEVLSDTQVDNDAEIEVLMRSVLAQFEHYVHLNKRIGPDILMAVNSIKEADKLADVIATHLTLKIEDKQKLLEVNSLQKRLEMLFALMEKEISVLQVERKIRKRVQNQMKKANENTI